MSGGKKSAVLGRGNKEREGGREGGRGGYWRRTLAGMSWIVG